MGDLLLRLSGVGEWRFGLLGDWLPLLCLSLPLLGEGECLCTLPTGDLPSLRFPGEGDDRCARFRLATSSSAEDERPLALLGDLLFRGLSGEGEDELSFGLLGDLLLLRLSGDTVCFPSLLGDLLSLCLSLVFGEGEYLLGLLGDLSSLRLSGDRCLFLGDIFSSREDERTLCLLGEMLLRRLSGETDTFFRLGGDLFNLYLSLPLSGEGEYLFALLGDLPSLCLPGEGEGLLGRWGDLRSRLSGEDDSLFVLPGDLPFFLPGDGDCLLLKSGD